jgi:hypothetical protein
MISFVAFGCKHDLSKGDSLVRIMLRLRLPLHRTPEKGRKDRPTAANITVKGGQIEVIGH